MNLYQKLIEVRKQIKYIQKSAQGYKFEYATEGQILAVIRPMMDEMGVFLESEMNSLEPVDCWVTKDKTQMLLKGLQATFVFTWTNAEKPEETITKTVIVQNIDSAVTTVGGLLTYAHRYFLFKFFSVPTDKLDPDAFENSIDRIVDKLEVSGEVNEEFISKKDLQTVKSKVDGSPEYAQKILNFYKIDSLDRLPASAAPLVLRNVLIWEQKNKS